MMKTRTIHIQMKTNGAVVQLGERFTCTEEVAGSNPVSSTYVVVSEWLGSGLQTRSCEFESHPRLKENRCR